MSKISFHEVCLLWKMEKERYVKVSTMAAYSLIIQNHLEPRFRSLDDVRQGAVQDFVDAKLSEGMGLTTVRGLLIVLKMILRFGEKRGMVGHRVIEVRFPTQRIRPQMPVLSVIEERRMLSYLAVHRNTYNLGLQICLFTGIRIGELCALKWGGCGSGRRNNPYKKDCASGISDRQRAEALRTDARLSQNGEFVSRYPCDKGTFDHPPRIFQRSDR